MSERPTIGTLFREYRNRIFSRSNGDPSIADRLGPLHHIQALYREIQQENPNGGAILARNIASRTALAGLRNKPELGIAASKQLIATADNPHFFWKLIKTFAPEALLEEFGMYSNNMEPIHFINNVLTTMSRASGPDNNFTLPLNSDLFSLALLEIEIRITRKLMQENGISTTVSQAGLHRGQELAQAYYEFFKIFANTIRQTPGAAAETVRQWRARGNRPTDTQAPPPANTPPNPNTPPDLTPPPVAAAPPGQTPVPPNDAATPPPDTTPNQPTTPPTHHHQTYWERFMAQRLAFKKREGKARKQYNAAMGRRRPNPATTAT